MLSWFTNILIDCEIHRTLQILFTLEDGLVIETVVIPSDKGRNTVCVSSQVGCAMNCQFCYTGRQAPFSFSKPYVLNIQCFNGGSPVFLICSSTLQNGFNKTFNCNWNSGASCVCKAFANWWSWFNYKCCIHGRLAKVFEQLEFSLLHTERKVVCSCQVGWARILYLQFTQMFQC